MFWNSKSINRKRATEQLDEIIFNTIESLGNNQKQPNEDTSVTMEKLTTLLGKEKLLNKPHRGSNSYF